MADKNRQILDIHGNPIRVDVLREPQTQSSQIMSLRREMSEHPSQRLTPTRLVSILNEAENGDIRRQSDLFDDIEERDGQIFADMQKRKTVLLTLDYRIEPPPNAEPFEKEDAEYLTEAINNLPGWNLFLLDCLNGIGHGFANIEIEWKQIGTEHVIKKLHYRPQSWFTVDKTDKNTLLLRTDDNKPQPLRPFGWVLHRHQSRSGYIARIGLFRTLSWLYLFRNFGVQTLLEVLEIYGIPIRIGKYGPGATKSERRELLRAVTELGRSAGGIIPEEMKIDIINAVSGSSDPHMALVNWASKCISMCILGGTLTSQADGKTSTNALGEVHNEVRLDLMKSDAMQLAETITRDILWPLLTLNRPNRYDPRRLPKLVFDIPDKIDIDLIQRLVEMDYPVSREWVMKKTNIPQAQSDEPMLKSPSKQVDNFNGMFNLLRQDIAELKSTAVMMQALTSNPLLNALLTAKSSESTQAAIDNMLKQKPTGSPAAAMLEPALMKIAAARHLDDEALLGVLADVFPHMDASLLAEECGNVRAIARLIGMFEMQNHG
jgi:phage gp29-like protein